MTLENNPFPKRAADDQRPVDLPFYACIDEDKLNHYLGLMTVRRPSLLRLDRTQQLKILNLTRDSKFTLAALLNFGVYPQGSFPQLGITAVAVPSAQIGDTGPDHCRFLDNRRIEGTISEMVQEAMKFCIRNMKVRKGKTEYPLEALHEAILNALIHRDYFFYTEGKPVQINIFTDRVEIHSPGHR